MLLQLIKSIRPINLLVITLTFYVLYTLDVRLNTPTSIAFYQNIIDLRFLSIAVLLIAAGGYLINDYYDKNVDAINKPNATPKISDKTLLTTYIAINTIALLLACIYSDSIEFFMVFPGTIIALWLYSAKLKGMPFIGNLTIAILSAIVPYIYITHFHSTLTTSGQITLSQLTSIEIMLLFALLAFLASLAREIVKDIEDIDGDKANSLKTLPVVVGIKTSKGISIFFSILTLCILGFLINNSTYYHFNTLAIVCLGTTSVLTLLLAISKTYLGKQKEHFKHAGDLIKISMFGFLLFIYIHAITL